MDTITEEKIWTKSRDTLKLPYRLILCNDDHNTFEWVIECLMKICKHEYEQATQCSFIVHHKGKCEVKRGTQEKMDDYKTKLRGAGLSAIVEAV